MIFDRFLIDFWWFLRVKIKPKLMLIFIIILSNFLMCFDAWSSWIIIPWNHEKPSKTIGFCRFFESCQVGHPVKLNMKTQRFWSHFFIKQTSKIRSKIWLKIIYFWTSMLESIFDGFWGHVWVQNPLKIDSKLLVKPVF